MTGLKLTDNHNRNGKPSGLNRPLAYFPSGKLCFAASSSTGQGIWGSSRHAQNLLWIIACAYSGTLTLSKLHRLDCLGSHAMLDHYDFVNNYMAEMANEPILPEPWLRGHDLIHMGIKEGKLIGKILKEAYDAQMEGRFADRNQLLAWVNHMYFPQEEIPDSN